MLYLNIATGTLKTRHQICLSKKKKNIVWKGLYASVKEKKNLFLLCFLRFRNISDPQIKVCRTLIFTVKPCTTPCTVCVYLSQVNDKQLKRRQRGVTIISSTTDKMAFGRLVFGE